MTNFALNLSTKLNVETGLEYFIIAHDILNEIELNLVVLSVPMSYLMGMCCCGIARGNDMEMDKGQAYDMFSRIFRIRIYEFAFFDQSRILYCS